MTRFTYFLPVLAAIAILSSCKEEGGSATDEVQYDFTVSMAPVAGRSATWKAGDIVYFGDDVSTRPGFQFTAAEKDISADRKNLSAYYKKASPDATTVYAVCAKTGRIRMKVTEDVVIQYDGRLQSATVPVGVASPKLGKITLSPSLPVAEFSLVKADVSSVRITAGDPVFPEKVRGDFGNGGGSIVSKTATIIIPVSGKGPFYIPLIPGSGKTSLNVEFLASDETPLRTVLLPSVNLAAVAGSVVELGQLDKNAVGDDDPSFGEMELASVALKNMGVGLNFGSGFEATWESLLQNPKRDNTSYYETVANSVSMFTPKTFQAAAEAGYKCARIPATWHHHMDNYLTTEIDKVWIDRIEEVVNYAIDAGLYVILNMHHDAGSRVGRWCIADEEHYESTCTGIENIWGQIATRFKDYDHHLLFEAFNEILDDKNSWHYPKKDDSYEIVNDYYQVFVNTVRATGGNNVSRNLVLNTYGASIREPAISHVKMPVDVLPGHLMVEFHSYVPVAFCLESATDPRDNLIDSDMEEMQNLFVYAKRYLVDKGYPCILGEYGSYPKEGRSQNDRILYTKTITRLCLDNKIVPIIWYSPMSAKTRSEGTWTDPDIRDAMLGAYNEFLTTQQ